MNATDCKCGHNVRWHWAKAHKTSCRFKGCPCVSMDYVDLEAK